MARSVYHQYGHWKPTESDEQELLFFCCVKSDPFISLIALVNKLSYIFRDLFDLVLRAPIGSPNVSHIGKTPAQ